MKVTLLPSGEAFRVEIDGELAGHLVEDWREEFSGVYYFRHYTSAISLTKEMLEAIVAAWPEE